MQHARQTADIQDHSVSISKTQKVATLTSGQNPQVRKRLRQGTQHAVYSRVVGENCDKVDHNLQSMNFVFTKARKALTFE